MSSSNGKPTRMSSMPMASRSVAPTGLKNSMWAAPMSATLPSSSASSTSSRQPSPISKTYRQASTLFLTRRLPEALTTLLPLITPPLGVDEGEPASVATASKTTRVKVWSLYLTILNAIVELEPDEGKDAFGNQEWRSLCTKVREGDIWDVVVQNGYFGVEGDVDADVVINLATLLLAHARDQILNQTKLEAYLASFDSPNLDIIGRLSQSPSPSPRMNRYRSPAKGASGANTPRDLNSRVKILELYTLHVLLRNNEWDYAREFITMSSVLDEERREAFLQALQSLHEEQLVQEKQAKEEQERQEEQLRQEIEEAKRLRADNEERERTRIEEERAKREGSEVDYGIDEKMSHGSSAAASIDRNKNNRTPSAAARQARRPNGKAVAAPTLTSRASMVITRLRHVVEQLGTSLNANPVILARFLAFIIGIIIMFGHRGIRERIQRVLGASWDKIRATAGMGVKVTYI